MKYAAEENDGKIKKVRKIGLDPVLREGMEYEFTIVFDLSNEHVATSTKDRTGLFDCQFFTPSRDTGQKILAWLKQGSKSHYEPPVHMNQVSGTQNAVKELGEFFDASFSGTKKMRPVSAINK
ncbi:MAG: hypothetical protein E3K37_03310 [Candidatus Kuenenia sp.]|nr:hypothetical protein [Candidatus Kuenenia hertensis]